MLGHQLLTKLFNGEDRGIDLIQGLVLVQYSNAMYGKNARTGRTEHLHLLAVFMELPYWFKVCFPKFWELSPT